MLGMAVRHDALAVNPTWTKVDDQGVGIDPERREAIFQDFAQADGSATRIVLVRDDLPADGGQLAVQREDHAQAGRVEDARAREVEHEIARSGARVLLAEDNLVNQRVAVQLLKKLGCLVDVVQVLPPLGAGAVEGVGDIHDAALRPDPLRSLACGRPFRNQLVRLEHRESRLQRDVSGERWAQPRRMHKSNTAEDHMPHRPVQASLHFQKGFKRWRDHRNG